MADRIVRSLGALVAAWAGIAPHYARRLLGALRRYRPS